MSLRASLLLAMLLLTFVMIFSAASEGISQEKQAMETDEQLTFPLQIAFAADKSAGQEAKGRVGIIDSKPYEGPHLSLSLNWTYCQIHRIGNYAPFEVILSGSFFSDRTQIWKLGALLPAGTPNNPPVLYFCADVSGSPAPTYTTSGVDIPLTWEISLDGGPFGPMTLLADNTLTTTFPPGPHTFQLRIGGTPAYQQADGYYHLQLSQCLVPQL